MKPFLSVVVISYESSRELPRTLYSLSPRFQRDIAADEYEVIVVDNGSRTPPRVEDFAHLGLDLSILSVNKPTVSPCRAVNLGLNASIGKHVGVMIDGARIASAGLLARAREALASSDRAVVGTRGRYLGPELQRKTMRYGYDQALEDRLLESVDWQNDPDVLFAISVFDECSRPTWFGQVAESNALFMSRALWSELGGFDEAFVTSGGGFVNLDTWKRACHLPDVRPILLLGEATFHQFHGGVATNGTSKKIRRLHAEYVALRGEDHTRPTTPVTYWGSLDVPLQPDELIGHKGFPLPSRVLDGPMKGLLDMSQKPPPLPTPAPRPKPTRAAKPAAGKPGGGTKNGGKPGGGTKNGTGKKNGAGKNGAGKNGAGKNGAGKKNGTRPATPPPRGLRSAVARRLPPSVKTRLKRLLGR